MANDKIIATTRVNAKAEGLRLPLSAPAVPQTKAKPAAKLAEPIMAVKKVESSKVVKKAEPIAAAKQIAPKPAAKDALPPSKTASQPAKPASQLSKRPGKTAGGNDPIAAGWVTAAKSAESLGQEFIDLARNSIQAQLNLAEALIAARTPREALALQGNFARESLGNFTGGFAKLTGMSMELTQAIMAPIQARMP